MNSSRQNLTWNAIVAMRDDDIPLLHSALLIALDEYPDLDIAAYEELCAEQERELRKRLATIEGVPPRLAVINRYLFDELGYCGNQNDFYDPRNSYLNDVFERKLGIPISLGVIQLELARRVGIPLEGVSFPGHFLVRLPVDGGLVVLDPFQKGRSIDAQELKLRAQPHLGGQDIDDHQLLQILAPATHRVILMRMLRNLRGVYLERAELDKALRCADRLVHLAPNEAEEVRERGLLYLRLGYNKGAGEDLMRYLHLRPEADDAEAVRSALIDASAVGVTRLN